MLKIEGKVILITGGAGFIGSHTAVVLLESGYTPIIIDNFANSERAVIERIRCITGQSVRCYDGDCHDANLLRRIFQSHPAMAGVIHFAAYKCVSESLAQPQKYYHNNIGSLVTLLDVMLECGISNLVFSSSTTVYGQPDMNPITEEAPMKATPSVYGRTKQLCEEIIRDVVQCGQPLNAVALRYFNPIGAHPSGLIGELPIGTPNNLVPFITQTACGIRSSLTVFGNDYNTPDGTCIRDYIHVMDLAEAHVKALDYLKTVSVSGLYEKINVGTGEGSSVLDVVAAFEEVSGVKLNYVMGPRRPGDVESCYAHVGRARELLGWEARRSLAQAVDDAWRWQRNLQMEKDSAVHGKPFTNMDMVSL